MSRPIRECCFLRGWFPGVAPSRSVFLLSSHLSAADFPAPPDLAPAADAPAAARHPQFGTKGLSLTVAFQHSANIPGNEGDHLHAGGFEHGGRFFRNRTADDNHHLLGPQHLEQLKGPIRIEGERGDVAHGATVDLDDEQSAGRVEHR